MTPFPETIGALGYPINTPAVGSFALHAYFIKDGEIVGLGVVHHVGVNKVRVQPSDESAIALFADHYLMSDPGSVILGDMRFPTYWATTGAPSYTFSDEPEGHHMGTIVVGVLEYSERNLPTETLWKINFK